MTGATFLACVAVFFAIAIVLGLLASRRLRGLMNSSAAESSLDCFGIAAFLLVASFGSAVLA